MDVQEEGVDGGGEVTALQSPIQGSQVDLDLQIVAAPIADQEEEESEESEEEIEEEKPLMQVFEDYAQKIKDDRPNISHTVLG